MLVRIFIPWIVLAGILGVAVGGSIVWLGEPPPQQQTGRAADAEEQSPPAAPPLHEPHPSENPPKTNAEKYQVKDHALEFFNVKLTDVLIAIFTIVLAVKTAGLFTETAGLRSAANQQASDMAASIRAAQRSADAAMLTAKNLLRTTRPLCVLEEITLEPFIGRMPDIALPKGYRFASIHGTIKNKGSAAAFAREMQMGSCVAPEIGSPLAPESQANSVFGFGELAAGDTYNRDAPVYLAPINDEFDRGEQPLFVWGWLRYADIHGITRRSGFAFQCPRGINAGGRFSQCGPPSYWYDIEEEPPA